MNKEQKKNSSNSIPIKVINNPMSKVVLATSLLTSIGASLPVTEQLPSELSFGVEKADAATTGKKLINAYVGETIKFGGADWVVLDPFAGLVQRKQPISMKALDSNGLAKYDVNDPNNVAHFLNTTWFNMLKPEEQNMIQMKTWTIQKRLWYIHRTERTSWSGNSGTTDTGWAWEYKDFYETVDAKVGIMDTNIGYGSYYNLAKATGGTDLNLFINTIDNRQEYTSRYNSGSGNNSSSPHTPPATYLTSPRPSAVSRDSLKPTHNPSDYNKLSYTYNLGLAVTTPTYVQPFIYLDPSVEINGDGSITANSAPTIVTSTPNNMTLSSVTGKNKFKIEGTVKDANPEDMLYVKYTIDGIPYHTNNNISYFTATGGNQPYETEINIDANIPEGSHTLRIWVEDGKGAKSADIVRTFTVDKTAPVITFTDVENGKVYPGLVTPTITVIDSSQATHTMKLNSKSYTGGAITESGKHELEVNAIDEVGNSSTKSITFEVNQTPVKIGQIDNKKWEKFHEETFDLTTLFKDAENDKLSYSVKFNSDTASETVVSHSIIGNQLKLTANAIGKGKITIQATDGKTESEAHEFEVEVTTIAPKLTITNDTTVITDKENKIKIQGTVNDPDKENVVITGVLDGITQTATILTTGKEDAWSLTFDGNGLTDGVHQLTLEASDPYEGKDNYSSEKVIVKVPGTIANYDKVLVKYEVDIKKNRQVMSLLEHTNILDAYISIEALKTNNNPSEWAKAKEKVELLVDGIVKTEFTNIITKNAFDYLIDNVETVTPSDLENAGITDVIEDNLKDYQEALKEYSDEKTDKLTKEEIQQIIDVINAVKEAQNSPDSNTIKDSIDLVNQLEDGELKDRLLEKLKDLALDYVLSNTDKVTSEDLKNAGLIFNKDNIDSYKEYFKDHVSVTKEGIQNAINEVDSVLAAYKKAIEEPSKVNVVAYEVVVNTLKEGTFKNKMKELIDDVALVYLISSPSTQEMDDYNRLSLTVHEAKLTIYNANVELYIQDLKDSFEVSSVQSVLVTTDTVLEAIENSSTTNNQLAITEISKLQDGKLKTKLKQELSSKILEGITQNPGDITTDDLINIGIEDVKPELEDKYKDALDQYNQDKESDLDLEDIQTIIDSINAVDKAENGTAQDIIDANDKINELEEGTLKEELKKQIEDAALNEIIKNPGTVTEELLEIGKIENVDKDIINDYQDALEGYVQPLTQESIQMVIDVTNLLQKTKFDLKQADLDALSEAIGKMSDSATKSSFSVVYEALTCILKFENDMSDENFKTMNEYVDSVTTNDKTYLQQMTNALAKVKLALNKPTDTSVNTAQIALSMLSTGNFKDRHQQKIGSSYLDYVINNPSEVTEQDLINAGFDNVSSGNLDKYKEAIQDGKSENGSLTKEQIQNIIDAINSVEIAKKKPSIQSIGDGRKAVEKLQNGKLKTNLSKELDALHQSIQPKPTPPSGGGGSVETPTQPKPEVKPDVPKDPEISVPKEYKMTSSNEVANIQIEVPKLEVAVTDSLKVQVKVQAKDIMAGSKLYIYADTVKMTASLTNNYLADIKNNKKIIAEIDFGKLEKGTVEVTKELEFETKGDYILNATFIAEGQKNLETNAIKVTIFNELKIPNTVLPNKHDLAVATLKTKAELDLYTQNVEGKFVKAKTVSKDTLLHIYDSKQGYYKLDNNLYAAANSGTVHIGKGEVRKDKVTVYDKNGKALRTIKKGQEYKVYSYDDKRYAIGGGEFIEVQDGVTYVFGWMKLKESMTLYKNDGSVERTLKKGDKYRIYSVDQEYLHLGGGYKVKLDLTKLKFTKN